jgi:lipopolysaccharide transport system ATP-binding protein
MPTVISVEHLSKAYRLGQIGTGTLTYDMKLWWAKVRGKPNPLLRIDEPDHGNRNGETIWALKDVSFKVEQGQVLGIIGRNGAGKSTLLKILSRVTAPTSGRITGRGRIASLLEVGTGFHPDLTGRENIYLNGAILGMSRREIDRKFDEIVDFAEIEKFIDTPVKRYSSGMYVRLAFAVAAHLEPEILVVDEVLAVGDAAFQRKCLGKMGEVAHEGRTVLFVSHDMTNISVLCSCALLLENGKVADQGSSHQVISVYLKSRSSERAAMHWDLKSAPGNEAVRLVAVSACLKGEDKPKEVFTIEQDISFNIEFKVISSAKKVRLNPVIRVRNLGGLTLFTTSNYDNKTWGRYMYENGTYWTTCTLPGHILNDGIYLVDIMMVYESREVWAEASGVMQFAVVDNGSTRGDYVGDWNGVMRPYCSWNGDKLNE